MKKYYDEWGLVTPDDIGAIGENSILYSVENFFLTGDPEESDLIQRRIMECHRSKGIYIQHPSGFLTGDDEFMSRDQLIAIFCFSVNNELFFHIDIWKEIKRQWFRYNNVRAPKTFWEKLTNPRFIHPIDLIFYGNCSGCFLWKLLLPILWCAMLFTILKVRKVRPEFYKRIYYNLRGIKYNTVQLLATDGKLLTFIQCKAKKWKILKLFSHIIKKKFGSWNKVFRTFFPHKDHPNVIASMGI